MSMVLGDAKVGQKINVAADNNGYDKYEKTEATDQLITADVLYVGDDKCYSYNNCILLGWKRGDTKLLGVWDAKSAGNFFINKEVANQACNGYDYAYWLPKTHIAYPVTTISNKKKVSFKQIDVKDVKKGQEIYVIGQDGKKLKATFLHQNGSILIGWKNKKPTNHISWCFDDAAYQWHRSNYNVDKKIKHGCFISSLAKLYIKKERKNIKLHSLSSGDLFLFSNDKKKLIKGTFINANSKSSDKTLIVFKNKPKNKKTFGITSDQRKRYSIDPSYKYCCWTNKNDDVYFHSSPEEMKKIKIKDCTKGQEVSFVFDGKEWTGTFFGVANCGCCANIWFEDNSMSFCKQNNYDASRLNVPEKFKYCYNVTSDREVFTVNSNKKEVIAPISHLPIAATKKKTKKISSKKQDEPVLAATLNEGDEVIWKDSAGREIQGALHKHGSYIAICCKSNPYHSSFRAIIQYDIDKYTVPKDTTHLLWLGNNKVFPVPKKEKEIVKKKERKVSDKTMKKKSEMKQLSSFKVGDEVTLYLNSYGEIVSYKTNRTFKGIILAKPSSYSTCKVGIKKVPAAKLHSSVSRNTLYSYSFGAKKKHLTKGLTQYISISKYIKAKQKKADPINVVASPVINETKIENATINKEVVPSLPPKELNNIKGLLPYLLGATALKFGANCLENKEKIKKSMNEISSSGMIANA